jgi:hypothetical protein
MSAQHTPGPWIGVNEHGKYNSDHAWRASDEDKSSSEAAPIWAGGKVIALVVYSSNRFGLDAHTSIDANARLIAAAPDLLDELKRLRRAYVSLLETGRDRIIQAGGQCDTVEAMEAADPHLKSSLAAIAKATGAA